MPPTNHSRDRRPCYGMLDPRCWYSVDGAIAAAGIGETRLAEGRQAGILHPTNDGLRDWYLGKELIRFVIWKGKRSQRRKSA